MTQKDVVRYLLEHDRSAIAGLFARADRVRSRFVGSGVHLRGLIEFSNYCCQDCLYCGLRRSNRSVKRYRMLYAQIFNACRQAKAQGLQTIVLQSGEDRRYRVRDLCGLVTDIKKLGLAVTLSIGELSYAQYRQLRQAGADRYLLRFETSDPGLYASLRPGRTLAQRLRCLSWLKKLGFETGSGIMTGLPGQTAGSIADDICLFRKLDLDMIGIGPFIPHPHTQLAKAHPGSLELVLKVIALTRIMTKDTNIPATTAAGTIDPRGREKALRCGANVLMPNMTPLPYRRLYEIYPDKICITEGEFRPGSYLARMMRRIGRTIASGYGYRKGDR